MNVLNLERSINMLKKEKGKYYGSAVVLTIKGYGEEGDYIIKEQEINGELLEELAEYINIILIKQAEYDRQILESYMRILNYYTKHDEEK